MSYWGKSRRSSLVYRMKEKLRKDFNVQKGGYVRTQWLRPNPWHYSFNFNPRSFEPSKHKRGLLALVFVALTIALAGWVQDPGNGLFHHVIGGQPGIGNPDPDTVTQLYSATGGSGTSSEFSVNHVVQLGAGVPLALVSGNLWTGSQALRFNTNSTANGYAVAIAKTGFDPSPVSGKHLKLITFFAQTGGTLGAGDEFDVFFTRNSTAPTSSSWTPLTDNNVALLVRFFEVRVDGGGFDWGTNILIQQNPVKTISQEDAGTCGGGGSGYLCSEIDYSNGAYAPTSVTQVSFWLNFTGNAGTAGNPGGSGSCSSPGTFAQGGPGCSVSITTPSNTIRADTGKGRVGLPTFSFQGTTYYLGYSAPGSSQLAQYDVGLDTGSGIPNQIDPGGSQGTQLHSSQVGMAQIISTPVPVSPTIDTGGFFGPIIRALIAIGVFILNAILGFISFIVPALEAAFTFLEGIIRTVLNVVGTAFGFPSAPNGLGDDLFNFINSVITLFTVQVPNAFGQIGNIFNGWINVLTVVFTTGIVGQIFGFLSGILTFAMNLAGFGFTIFSLIVQTYSIGVPWWIFIFALAYNADDGVDGWIKTWELCKYVAFDIGVKTVTWVLNWTIDIMTAAIGLVPKPMVQMGAAKFPRIPIIDIHGSFTFPRFDGAALREGNLFSVIGFPSIFAGLVWYELTQTGIPGTLAALYSTQPWVTTATTAIAFYKLFLPIFGLVVFMLMIPRVFTSIFGVRVEGPQIPVSLGHRPQGITVRGGSGPLFVPAKKHLQRQPRQAKQREPRQITEEDTREVSRPKALTAPKEKRPISFRDVLHTERQQEE